MGELIYITRDNKGQDRLNVLVMYIGRMIMVYSATQVTYSWEWRGAEGLEL